MSETLRGIGSLRLERSCAPRGDSIRFGSGAEGLERAEVFLARRRYAPHRHDSYAVGITTHGVQVFSYRGARRVCLPGQLHILHPDETHDGRAGGAEGLGYRILYLAPALVGEALGGGPLPFVAEPVHAPGPAARRVADLLADLDAPVDELIRADAVATVADTLAALGGRPRHRGAVDLAAVARVREYLWVHACERTPAAALEQIAGIDRFTLARHFRHAFGTSPDRYRTLRRLALARIGIEAGTALARVAAETGFADQSHMTRQFKRAYGLTPAGWAALTNAPRPSGATPPGRRPNGLRRPTLAG